MTHPLVRAWRRSEQRLAIKRAERDAAVRSGLVLCARCGRVMTNAKASAKAGGICGKCALELMGDD